MQRTRKPRVHRASPLKITLQEADSPVIAVPDHLTARQSFMSWSDAPLFAGA